MRRRVRRTVSLPAHMSEELERTALAESTTVSAVVQRALRIALVERRRGELARVRDHWAREAAARDVLTEDDMDRLVAIVDAPGRDDAFGWED